jgi:hypothetical protein
VYERAREVDERRIYNLPKAIDLDRVWGESAEISNQLAANGSTGVVEPSP